MIVTKTTRISTEPIVIGFLTSFEAMPFEMPADCAKNVRITYFLFFCLKITTTTPNTTTVKMTYNIVLFDVPADKSCAF
jgi:hypothetical protein